MHSSSLFIIHDPLSMTLYIDTTNNLKTTVKLGDYTINKSYANPRSQELLTLINQILKKAKASVKEISEIKVNVGPGSFTGTRIGVTVANALAFALGIKVNGKKSVEPKYE
jgi:tRNA threonylcarbamoyladenosine biosynthesis protein TsaB